MLDYSINPVNKRYGHRCYTLCLEGTIVYDPSRGNKVEPHWCIIEVNKDITEYYRNQFKRKFGTVLFSPSFDAHVSLLKGFHTPKMNTEWKHLNGKKVDVWYDPNLYWNEKHVWLNT